MIRMGITGDMSISSALELFPQLFPLFQQIGMCCVNEENENLTVDELCRQYHVDTDSFLEASASVIS
jgi:hypothetical protein